MQTLRTIGRGACLALAGTAVLAMGTLGGCAEAGFSSRRSATMAELWQMRTGESVRPSGLGTAGGVRSEGPDRRGLTANLRRAQEVRELEMFDGASGSRVGWSELVERARGADVVVIGEVHGHATGLEAAAELFDEIVDSGARAALSMEFFEKDEQVALDDYLTGVTDEEAFREAAGRNANNYPEAHRRMVERAKRAGLDVIASNAPRRYVRYARRNGRGAVASFTSEQMRLMDMPVEVTQGRYRETFLEMFGFNPDGSSIKSEEESGDESHGMTMTYEDAQAFFFAQNIWDETMARSIADAWRGGAQPVVQVVGRFHSDFGGGLVERVQRLAPGARVLVVSMVNSDPSGRLAPDDMGRADVVIYTGEERG